MKRYILFFLNGKIVQQEDINDTYLNLCAIDILSYIIDTQSGQIYLKGADGKSTWYTIEKFEEPAAKELNKKTKPA